MARVKMLHIIQSPTITQPTAQTEQPSASIVQPIALTGRISTSINPKNVSQTHASDLKELKISQTSSMCQLNVNQNMVQPPKCHICLRFLAVNLSDEVINHHCFEDLLKNEQLNVNQTGNNKRLETSNSTILDFTTNSSIFKNIQRNFDENSPAARVSNGIYIHSTAANIIPSSNSMRVKGRSKENKLTAGVIPRSYDSNSFRSSLDNSDTNVYNGEVILNENNLPALGYRIHQNGSVSAVQPNQYATSSCNSSSTKELARQRLEGETIHREARDNEYLGNKHIIEESFKHEYASTSFNHFGIKDNDLHNKPIKTSAAERKFKAHLLDKKPVVVKPFVFHPPQPVRKSKYSVCEYNSRNMVNELISQVNVVSKVDKLFKSRIKTSCSSDKRTFGLIHKSYKLNNSSMASIKLLFSSKQICSQISIPVNLQNASNILTKSRTDCENKSGTEDGLGVSHSSFLMDKYCPYRLNSSINEIASQPTQMKFLFSKSTNHSQPKESNERQSKNLNRKRGAPPWLSQKREEIQSKSIINQNFVTTSNSLSSDNIDTKNHCAITSQVKNVSFDVQSVELEDTQKLVTQHHFSTSSNDKVQLVKFIPESSNELNWTTNNLNATSNQSLESTRISSAIASIGTTNQLCNTQERILDIKPMEVVQSSLTSAKNVSGYHSRSDILSSSEKLISSDKRLTRRVEESRPSYENWFSQWKNSNDNETNSIGNQNSSNKKLLDIPLPPSREINSTLSSTIPAISNSIGKIKSLRSSTILQSPYVNNKADTGNISSNTTLAEAWSTSNECQLFFVISERVLKAINPMLGHQAKLKSYVLKFTSARSGISFISNAMFSESNQTLALTEYLVQFSNHTFVSTPNSFATTHEQFPLNVRWESANLVIGIIGVTSPRLNQMWVENDRAPPWSNRKWTGNQSSKSAKRDRNEASLSIYLTPCQSISPVIKQWTQIHSQDCRLKATVNKRASQFTSICRMPCYRLHDSFIIFSTTTESRQMFLSSSYPSSSDIQPTISTTSAREFQVFANGEFKSNKLTPSTNGQVTSSHQDSIILLMNSGHKSEISRRQSHSLNIKSFGSDSRRNSSNLISISSIIATFPMEMDLFQSNDQRSLSYQANYQLVLICSTVSYLIGAPLQEKFVPEAARHRRGNETRFYLCWLNFLYGHLTRGRMLKTRHDLSSTTTLICGNQNLYCQLLMVNQFQEIELGC